MSRAKSGRQEIHDRPESERAVLLEETFPDDVTAMEMLKLADAGNMPMSIASTGSVRRSESRQRLETCLA